MIYRKQIQVVLALTGILAISIAAVNRPPADYKNLKVLPKDISSEKLDSIMESYNKALGVSCDFCHMPFQKNIPDSLDYASDEEPMKQNARKMMSMTIYINQTYFDFDKKEQPVYLNTVNCMTCHRGEALPEEHKANRKHPQ